ncbi:FUSC family membrane protein [Flavobacterium sp. 7A]|uniref:FUSC family membrane protein n=1 Tax=Flavobacterium sp. 7A TaxID=2940571 RepID=UPI0022278CBE|nr:FUSC family membrane protein [Flavobacterium sp. 7A]MCW2119244.1 putative membrane protein (TIGR01666 family) [Flavobacterium sp. 7A]
MIANIQKFTESTEFTNALKITIAGVLPVLLFSYLDAIGTGITIALGAFFVFPSDVPSILKHKINGLIASSLIISGITLLINLTYPYPWIFYPTLAIILFMISMIAAYDQRATMVAFSSLVAISIAFAHINTGIEIFKHSGLLLIGGFFYLFVSILFHYIKPNRYIELQIADCMKLTSKYLKLRGDLWEINSDRKEITKKQLNLQVELNAIHENIREILVRNRTNYGSSNQNRKMLLSFMSLVEIMELAISTSFDHNKLHQKFDDHPIVLRTYQNLAYNLAKTLKQLSKSILDKKPYSSQHNLIDSLHGLENAIASYKSALGELNSIEGVLMLSTMLNYAEKQVEKIKILERAFTANVHIKDLKGRDKELEKLIQHHYYPINTLVENFRFSSTIFRHSLRITVTILIGFFIGKILPFQNVYWILLTIVVIMRPGYGLTKERTYNRFIGTIIGGIIAFSILYLSPSSTILGTLCIACMLLGYSFNPTNYKIGTTFITMYVIFIFSILSPNMENLIQYRILDTIVGATLAILANYFLWPSWEFLNIPEYLEKSLEANRNYLKEFSVLYNSKSEVATSYRLARNQAFIGVGNLMASFQRMVQEPKSKQNNLQLFYKLTVLSNALLSSAASLGTYTQSNKTTDASDVFNDAINQITKKLDYAILLLNKNDTKIPELTAPEELSRNFTELRNIRAKELNQGSNISEVAYRHKMQEVQLVIEQLIWLTNLSDNIVKTTKQLLAKNQ